MIKIDFRSCCFLRLLICKEDRHVALTAQSAVNGTWRVFPAAKTRVSNRCLKPSSNLPSASAQRPIVMR